MSYKVYNSGNMLVVQDNTTGKVERLPRDEVWYEYNAADAPILYRLHYKSPERVIFNNDQAGIPYTEFQDKAGNGFTDDLALQEYLDKHLCTFLPSTLDVSGQIDAGGRLRVSQLSTQLDFRQFNDNQPLFFSRENVSGATQVYSKANGGVTMSVSSNGDAAICQSKMFANYFSGKSQFGEITFSGGQNQTNVTKRVGYFSSNTTTPFDSNKDGLWFEADGTDYRFRIQKNGSDILNVTQSNWNINTLPNADFSKFNVFVFQFLYLGGTEVRFGFIQNGSITWCHGYEHAGLVASTFVESPNQPVRYEVRSTGGSGSMDQICAQIASEGSIDEVGVHRSYEVEDFQANSAGTVYAAIGFRLKSGYRNISVRKQELRILTQNNDDCIWRISYNPTIANTFTYADQDNSALQVATGDTNNTISDLGTVIAVGYAQGNSFASDEIRSALRLGTQIDGTADEMVISIEPLTNGLDVYVAGGFQEFI